MSLPNTMTEITPTEEPTSSQWKFPLMFRYGNNGTMYLWGIGFDGSTLHILHGPTTSLTIDTNEVKTNTSGRSLSEQGLLQARAKYKNMFYKGYVQVGSIEPPMVKGMKGYPYQAGVMKGKPWLASPKLNGIRLICQHMGGDIIETRTYLNRAYHHFTLIQEQLLKLTVYMDGFITYDGELYTHGMDFYTISSVVKTKNNQHPDLPSINYCIFDYYSESNPSSEERYANLVTAYHQVISEGDVLPNIRIVPQRLITNETEAMKLKDYYVSQGYEGLVIKRAAGNSRPGSRVYEMSKYKYGRSTRLYKIKDFIDEEGEVVDVVSASGKEKGLALLVIKDQRGIRTNIRFGQTEERRSWLLRPDLVIGKSFTFKYFELGSQGAPVQPTGVGFRDYED